MSKGNMKPHEGKHETLDGMDVHNACVEGCPMNSEGTRPFTLSLRDRSSRQYSHTTYLEKMRLLVGIAPTGKWFLC